MLMCVYVATTYTFAFVFDVQPRLASSYALVHPSSHTRRSGSLGSTSSTTGFQYHRRYSRPLDIDSLHTDLYCGWCVLSRSYTCGMCHTRLSCSLSMHECVHTRDRPWTCPRTLAVSTASARSSDSTTHAGCAAVHICSHECDCS